MIDQTYWGRLNRWFGFLDDERRQESHGLAVRNTYLATLGSALLASFYQAATGWPDAPLWPVSLVIMLSLVALVVRRIQLAGLGPADERIYRLRKNIFYWAYIVLVVGLFLYASYLFWGLGDNVASMLWTGCYLLALPVIWLSHLWHDTAQGRFGMWLAVAVLTLGSLVPGVVLLIVSLVQSQPLPTFRSMIPILFYLAPPLFFGIMAAGAAWRSWRAERGADA